MGLTFFGSDRRKFQRVKVDFSVSYLVREPMEVSMRVEGKKVKTIMFDISEEGMALKSEYDVPLRALLTIDFILEYASKLRGDIMRRMEIEGRIVNKRTLAENMFRYGVHFEKIRQEDREAIVDFVRCFLNKEEVPPPA
jgi:c-di-GMP-binding flagellar brake protein YcgR